MAQKKKILSANWETVQVKLPPERKAILKKYCEQNHLSVTRFIENKIDEIIEKKLLK